MNTWNPIIRAINHLFRSLYILMECHYMNEPSASTQRKYMPEASSKCGLRRSSTSWGKVILDARAPDNVVIIGNRPGVITAVEGNTINCRRFQTVNPLFQSPLDSSKLLIFLVSNLSEECTTNHFHEIRCKCACFPLASDQFAIVPLSHSFYNCP